MLEIPPCPACGAPLDPDGAALARGEITCPACGAVLEVDVEDAPEPAPAPGAVEAELAAWFEEASGGDDGGPATPPVVAPRVPADTRSPFGAEATEALEAIARARDTLPRGLRMRSEAGALELVRTWLDAKAWFLLFFALFWNGIVSVFVVSAVASGEWFVLAFISLHMMAGLFVGYWALASFLNRTRVRVTADHLTVRHGPLPWPGARDLRSADVDQLYVAQRVQTNSDGKRSVSYELLATLRGGEEVTLMSGLSGTEQARAVEARVEAALGIADRPMPGEHHDD